MKKNVIRFFSFLFLLVFVLLLLQSLRFGNPTGFVTLNSASDALSIEILQAVQQNAIVSITYNIVDTSLNTKVMHVAWTLEGEGQQVIKMGEEEIVHTPVPSMPYILRLHAQPSVYRIILSVSDGANVAYRSIQIRQGDILLSGRVIDSTNPVFSYLALVCVFIFIISYLWGHIRRRLSVHALAQQVEGRFIRFR